MPQKVIEPLPQSKKTRVLAIIIKGRRKTLIERKAIEWQDIKATKMIGSEHKRNGKRSIYCAFLVDSGDNIVDEILPSEIGGAVKDKSLFDTKEEQL